MGIAYNPKIVTDGLVLCLDAANQKSYPGTGTAWTDPITLQQGTVLTDVTYSTDPHRFNTNATTVTQQRHLSTPTLNFADTSTYSMEFWIKLRPSAAATFHSLAGRGASNQWLTIYSNDTTGQSWHLRYRQNGGTYNISTNITDWNIQSNWACICISVSSSRAVSFYLNGLLRDVLSPTTTLFTVNRVAGGYSSGSNRFALQGFIAAVKMYSQQLSAQEVLQNFNALRGRFEI